MSEPSSTREITRYKRHPQYRSIVTWLIAEKKFTDRGAKICAASFLATRDFYRETVMADLINKYEQDSRKSK